MTREEKESIIACEDFINRLEVLHQVLVDQIKKHTKLKYVYRYTPKRDSSIGRAYISSCKKIKGVHWVCKQSKRLIHKGILHLEDSTFDRDYMVKVIKSLPINEDFKNELITDFLED